MIFPGNSNQSRTVAISISVLQDGRCANGTDVEGIDVVVGGTETTEGGRDATVAVTTGVGGGGTEIKAVATTGCESIGGGSETITCRV